MNTSNNRNTAHVSGEQDPSRDFHRLGNLIESCDTPLKKLVDEILPLSLRVGLALKSLHNLHNEKNLHINEMRDHSVYKLISQVPGQGYRSSCCINVLCSWLKIIAMIMSLVGAAFEYGSRIQR